MAVHSEYIVSIGGEAGNIITNEIPTGVINSTNTDFEILNTPLAGTVEVFLNGLLQAPGTGKDYNISGKDISFTKAPRTGSDLLVSYAEDTT